jgi:hypothetical protein
MVVVTRQFSSSCTRVDLKITDQYGVSPKIILSKLIYLIYAVDFGSNTDL